MANKVPEDMLRTRVRYATPARLSNRPQAALPSGNIEFSTEGRGRPTPLRDTFQITEPEARALRTDLDLVLAAAESNE